MNHPLDILFVHHLPVMGGATQSLLGLVKHAMKNGLVCKVLFLRNEGNAIERYRKEGIDVITIDNIHSYAHAYGAYNTFISRRPWRVITNLAKSFSSVNKVSSILSQERPRLVYLNTSVLIPFAIAAQKKSIPVIWHLREQIHNGNFGIRKKMVQSLFAKYATQVIAISQVNASVLGIKGIDVIYNSVDFNVFNKDLDAKEFKHKFQIKEPYVLCFLGGRVLSKGADLLVEAVVELLKHRQDFQVVIAGDFNTDTSGHLNKIEKKVMRLMNENEKLKQVLIFTGALSNTAQLIASSDILIWPATTPHFARPIMEAMVMSKAVVATDFMSSSEVLEHNKHGLLVAPNPTALCSSINALMQDNTKRIEMGIAAYNKAKDLFDAQENNNKIIKNIKQLLN